MSSGESWTRSADSAVPEDGSTGDSKPRRTRSRWRGLSRPALREESAPPAEELGEDAYWSYLRGDRDRPSLGDGAERRTESPAEPSGVPPQRSAAPARQQSGPPELKLFETPPEPADAVVPPELRISERTPAPAPAETPAPPVRRGRGGSGPRARMAWPTSTRPGSAQPADEPAETAQPAGETAQPAGETGETAQPTGAPAEPSSAPETAAADRPTADTADPVVGAADPATGMAVPTTAAASRRGTAIDAVTGQPPVPDGQASPAWRKLIGSGRRERVLPGIAGPVTLTALVALGWFAVVAYGVFRFDVLWGLLSLAAGAGALALGLRGRSVIGLAPVLVGAAAWGMATGGQAPASFSDLLAVLRLIGWNVLYAVPLLIAYGLATGTQADLWARGRVRTALGERRWWGAADVPDAEPRITAMEAVPAARFFQLTGGSCPHLVTAGRQVALVRSTVWPRGAYTVTQAGEVHRNGRTFAHGREDLNGVIVDARTWSERLGSVATTVVGFLVVHPASDRPGDRVELDIPQTGGVRVINAEEFVAVVGDFLGAEPYRLDVALAERLGEHLPVFEPAA